MAGRAYTIFDTAIGRCGIAWGDAGIVGVQLPEAREIETRKRLYRLYPDARETRPPANVELAIEGIVTLLRGESSDFANVTLDMSGIHGFNQRVYQITRAIPRGKPGPIARSQPGSAPPAPRTRSRGRSPATPL